MWFLSIFVQLRYKKIFKISRDRFKIFQTVESKGNWQMLFTRNTPEVAIIGAGIAGIAAAQTLHKHKIKTIVLEASHRTGGRAYSEELSPNNWFDLGCSYLHNGNRNPFLSIAQSLNIPIDIKNGNLFDAARTKYFESGIEKNFQYKNPLKCAETKLLDKINVSTKDQSIFAFMDTKNLYFPVLSHLYSSLNAADPDLVSARDYNNSLLIGPDYPVPGGFGNLIKAWSKKTPVQLNTFVKKIYWDKSPLQIETNKGTYSADKVIITVSTSILSNNHIKMIPELPEEKVQALANLPMGTLNKIGLSFSKPSFSKKDRAFYVSWPKKNNLMEEDVGSFEINVSGANNIAVFVGGRYAKWLEQRGSLAMREYAINKVESVLGSSYTKHIDRVITTAWGSDPLSKGSYSYALPSNKCYRNELGKSIENTIFFAGEATETSTFGTAHGAYLSGKKAAKEIIEKNKR